MSENDQQKARTTQPEETEDSAPVWARLYDSLTDSPNYDEFDKRRHALAEWFAVRLMFVGIVVAVFGVLVQVSLRTVQMMPEIQEMASDVALWWLEASVGMKFVITGIVLGALGFITLWYSMLTYNPPRNTEDATNEQ